MIINRMADLVEQAESRAVSRDEVKGWNPIIIMDSVDFITGALEGIGPAVRSIEEALALLESGELIRLAKERAELEEKLLQNGW